MDSPEGEAASAAPAADERADEAHPDVLVVDDDEKNLKALSALLSELPCRLLLARSGVEALRILMRQDVAVILVDVQMPEMDGLELAEMVRSRVRSRRTPIIFLTAFSRSDQQLRRAYQLGAVDFRRKAVPRLASEGAIRAWHAGCATGEEVWSHAIVLQEEGLGGIARFYGTDLSPASLLRAQRGLLPLERMREYTSAHYRAGGRADFSAYYATDGAGAVVRSFLRRRAAFGRHDLVAAGRLGTFDVVFCRNVLIYFDAPLQERVHALLYDSLRPGGILALGHGEALTKSMRDAYEPLDERTKLFVRLP
ncbi:MAG TPA: CheR family methyltransferase [Anaeromyxobacter sp.]